jgi:hypothetical protein
VVVEHDAPMTHIVLPDTDGYKVIAMKRIVARGLKYTEAEALAKALIKETKERESK